MWCWLTNYRTLSLQCMSFCVYLSLSLSGLTVREWQQFKNSIRFSINMFLVLFTCHSRQVTCFDHLKNSLFLKINGANFIFQYALKLTTTRLVVPFRTNRRGIGSFVALCRFKASVFHEKNRRLFIIWNIQERYSPPPFTQMHKHN